MEKMDTLIVLGKRTNGEKFRSWDCYCRNERVGEITWRREPGMWEKAYDARLYIGDEQTDHISWHDSFYAAKISIAKCIKNDSGRVHRRDTKKTPVAFLPSADMEFYPTPSSVAGDLFAGVDWRNVRTILEPSAGKGDLLDYAKEVKIGRNYQGWQTRLKDRNLEIDCVELDENLRHILTGKGYRVVHDDFLTFYTRKRYDLILMNPPFSNGEYHLLHALELCENGGQIACILNAETLRNTYTKSRITLMKELNKHHASIRYRSKAFKDAERKADVDVALINVIVPAKEDDTSIYDGLKKAGVVQDDDIAADKDLTLSNPVERLIREYDVFCAAGIELMRKYNGVAKYIMSDRDSEYAKPIIQLSVGGHDAGKRCNNDTINAFLKVARGRYWHELFNIPKLRDKMTSSMRDQYSSMVDSMKDYEFSMFNVQQVLDQIRAQLNEGVEEAIMKCFEKLSNEHAYHEDIENENIHYFNGWKTNKAHYVNKRCIIPTWGCFARKYVPDKRGNYRDVYTDIEPRGCFRTLDDLEKALDYLDKGETPCVSLMHRLEAAAKEGRTSVACKYFNVRFYKKGTCHIEFYDQKILDRLNIFAARKRMWLPPTYGKVKYNDMDSESQRVVDEFLGREHYETVMQKPNEYLIEGSAVPLLAEAM